jgi:tetratricopeptide (TPR) repeat protein
MIFAHCTSHRKPLDAEKQYKISPELLHIDSLMWLQPDSATKELSRFWANYNIDSTDAFNKHYFNLLVSEALFKGGYPQSNRKRLLKAVDYFDTTDYWLSARAHYMNGVGFKAEDSVVEALYEYLHVLDIVDEHIPTPPHPRFMMLIHCRIGDLFSDQYMQEPAIVCYENALKYNNLGECVPFERSILLQKLGFQYDKLQKYDTARYYYDEALHLSPDINNSNYKMLQFYKAMLDCTSGADFEHGIVELKQLASQCSESSRDWRYVNIGLVYQEAGHVDSALVYLQKAFDYGINDAVKSYVAEFIYDIYESQDDTLKMAEFAEYLIEKPSNERVSMARVSTLNSMFQDYQTRHQERLQHQNRKRIIITVSIVLAIVLLMVSIIVKLIIKKKTIENQKLQEEKQCLQNDYENSKRQQFEALQNRVKSIFKEKNNNSLPLIINEFKSVYLDILNNISKDYPNLSETEKNILILTLLNFRIKEEAVILNLSENTVMKYRSNLKKKVDFDQISSQIR